MAEGAYTGLIVDWGGVMTTNLLASFSAFCDAEGLDREAVAHIFRRNAEARELLFAFEEGRIEETEFELRLAELLGVAVAEGLIDRLFAGSTPDLAMVEAVRAARAAAVPTGLISNSWGVTRYPRDLLEELFSAVLLSGELGIRKPHPRIYSMGAEALGLPAQACVFVDDLPFNLPPAQELGMGVVHHVSADETIPELERLLGVSLGAGA